MLYCRYATAYSRPTRDVGGDEDIQVSWNEGVAEAVITRRTDDTASDDISVDGCRYLMLAKGSGFTANGMFNQHSTTPVRSEKKICFTQEGGEEDVDEEVTTVENNNLRRQPVVFDSAYTTRPCWNCVAAALLASIAWVINL